MEKSPAKPVAFGLVSVKVLWASCSLFLLVSHDILLSPCLKGTWLVRLGLMAWVFWR